MHSIVAFGVIGGGLKYIDEAIDEEIFNKKSAILLALLLVGLWIAVSIVDAISATILFAILGSVFLAGKLDNGIFKISSISIVLAALLSGKISILWPPFLALTLAGIMDEIGNNYVDNNRTNKVLEFFFLHRFVMKIGVFTLCAISIFPWTYLLAFLAFDMSYDSVGILGQWTRNVKAGSRLSLNTARKPSYNFNTRINTTAVFIYNDEPKGLSGLTFYFPVRDV